MASEEDRLLQSVKESISSESGSEERASYLVIGVSLAIIISSIIVMGMVATKNSKLKTVDQQITDEVTSQLKTLEKESIKTDTLLKQSETFISALASKTSYSQMLKDLKLNQYKNSQWTSLVFDDGKFTLTAETDNPEEAAKAISALKKMKSVKTLEVTSLSINETSQRVEFTANITVDQSLYKLTAKTAQPVANSLGEPAVPTSSYSSLAVPTQAVGVPATTLSPVAYPIEEGLNGN